MKVFILAILSALLITVQANSWYVPSRNITCTGYDDGHINCESGHLFDAPEVSPPVFRPVLDCVDTKR